MPLMDLSLSAASTALPGDVRAFLTEADQRIERFRTDRVLPGFVPSDYAGVYRALREVAESRSAPGELFCEWGSGFGVVACLAAMLDFDACGIEIEAELVDAARQLAADFNLPVEFVRGSFIPTGSVLGDGSKFSWLCTGDEGAEEELGLTPSDFDMIFVYPWPDEEKLMEDLFEQHARAGALLMAYHGGDIIKVKRKVARSKRRR